MTKYEKLSLNLAKGWNTWNTRSVLSHVLLPQAFAINLCIKEFKDGNYLKEALIGRSDKNDEIIHPGAHTYDGSYTQLNLKWRGIEVNVESAVRQDELVLLITPLKNQKCHATLVVETGILWNSPGCIVIENGIITGVFQYKKIRVHTTKPLENDSNIPCQTPYIPMKLYEPIGISTGKKYSVDEIKAILSEKKVQYEKNKEKYGTLAEAYEAMQSCMAGVLFMNPQAREC
jgi:putative isomerase